jgi:hypothetical protein
MRIGGGRQKLAQAGGVALVEPARIRQRGADQADRLGRERGRDHRELGPGIEWQPSGPFHLPDHMVRRDRYGQRGQRQLGRAFR